MNIKHLFAIFALALLAVSCKTPTDITYFQNLNPGDYIVTAPMKEITAEPDDRLSILVHAQDGELAEIFNMAIQSRRIGVTTGRRGAGVQSQNSNQTASYVVDSFGDIEFPELGTIHIGGMTRQEIAKYIKDELVSRKLLKNPTVTVEFLDHGFTALGAVGSPGRIIFERDRLTLPEAIALAGDLQIDGQRTNVKIFRMVEGKETAYEVDLTNANSVLQSPAYYIQQNDIIYVEPNDKAKRNTTANGNSVLTPGFWFSIVSFVTSMTLIFVKL